MSTWVFVALIFVQYFLWTSVSSFFVTGTRLEAFRRALKEVVMTLAAALMRSRAIKRKQEERATDSSVDVDPDSVSHRNDWKFQASLPTGMFTLRTVATNNRQIFKISFPSCLGLRRTRGQAWKWVFICFK